MLTFTRFLLVFLQLGVFFIRALYIILTSRDPIRRRQRQARNTTYIARLMLRSFRIKTELINPANPDIFKEKNHFVVSNHVSYIDIIVLSSCHPMVFITSLEMAANPILGDITRLGGSLFTNRKKRTTLPQEINKFAVALQQGFNVVLFPEGTSTNGARVYDFKKSLFQTAIIAQADILPVCIKYTTLDGRPILTQEQRDVVCWYATDTFIPHLWKLLRHRIKAEVRVLNPIPFDPAHNRQQISDLAFRQISETYRQN
jgi:lyso-ornithine lipid O-acyltransferase